MERKRTLLRRVRGNDAALHVEARLKNQCVRCCLTLIKLAIQGWRDCRERLQAAFAYRLSMIGNLVHPLDVTVSIWSVAVSPARLASLFELLSIDAENWHADVAYQGALFIPWMHSESIK